MIKCNRCSLKLGILKRKYPYEDDAGDAVIICSKCYVICVEEDEENTKKVIREEERKNKEVISEYLTKYLASKEWDENVNISGLLQDKSKRKLFTGNTNTLVNAREHIESDLQYYLSLNSRNYNPEQNEELLEEIEKCEEYIELFDDLKNHDLDIVQELIILEVALRIINADKKQDENEIKFIHLLRSKLRLHDETILERFGPLEILHTHEYASHVKGEEKSASFIRNLTLPDVLDIKDINLKEN